MHIGKYFHHHENHTEEKRVPKEGAVILCHLDAEGRLMGASGIGQGNSIARDIRLLEMLIGKKASPDVAQLADSAFPLKSLLRS